MTGDLRIGCSGWSYKDWRGIVYPAELPQRRWLEHYQQLFDTVELNSTFYRLPADRLPSRAGRRPPGQVFCTRFKLGAFGSHRKKLARRGDLVAQPPRPRRRLGGHLGPTLVQLPPRWKRNVQRLDEFLDGRALVDAVGGRAAGSVWLHDDVFEVLRRHGVALCIHDLLADASRSS